MLNGLNDQASQQNTISIALLKTAKEADSSKSSIDKIS